MQLYLFAGLRDRSLNDSAVQKPPALSKQQSQLSERFPPIHQDDALHQEDAADESRAVCSRFTSPTHIPNTSPLHPITVPCRRADQQPQQKSESQPLPCSLPAMEPGSRPHRNKHRVERWQPDLWPRAPAVTGGLRHGITVQRSRGRSSSRVTVTPVKEHSADPMITDQ